MSKVAVIGAGAYGTALGGVLAENGFDVDYYDPEKEKECLRDVVNGASTILLSAPSDVVMRLLSHLPKNRFLIIASKGFLSEKPFAEFDNWAVLSGAGFADDIKAKKRVRLTVTDERVAKMFDSDAIKFDFTDDKLGVLLCGALKNVYAIRAGELGLKSNTKKKEEYIYNVVKEIAAILYENGAEPKTVRLACGMKDLILTCGPNSRNYQFGQALRTRVRIDTRTTVEGLTALRRIRNGEIEVPESATILKSILEESTRWG